MPVSIHVGVIVVRTQIFVLIYELILIPPNICINKYNYYQIYWISNDLIHIEFESASKTFKLAKSSNWPPAFYKFSLKRKMT